MACSRCGADTTAGQKFCFQCGQPLGGACEACAAPLAPGARFCGECGRPVGSTAAAPAAEPVPERRLVSVLFADLVGFTTLAERRDPEEVRQLLSRYFDLVGTIVRRYGGVVEKFIGDAVMAVWGTPVAHEDDAERAVRAALEIAPAVGRLGERAGFPDLTLRVGVATGEAAVLIDAPGEGMVAGDLVNTASRIEEAAAAGCILVNEATYRATRRAVSFEPAGTLSLKGKEASVAVYRAEGISGPEPGVVPIETEIAFVGRSAELQLLLDLLERTADDGRGHLVSIMGIAGVGKSRLVAELERTVAGSDRSVIWLRGRSPAYGEGVTFRALAQMVRRRAGIDDRDGPDSAAAKLEGCLERSVPPEDRDLVGTGLATLLDLPGGGGLDSDQLFASWRRFFEALAAEHPVVLVFEDLQWADAGLLDYIESLLLWSRHVPIFVITLARPEILDRRPSWGAGQAAFTAIHLEPLTGAEMRELLGGLVPGIPADAVEAVSARAEGVPLYAIETVRMLLDRGIVTEREDGFELTGMLDSLAIPESLHALVAARLDALDPEDRRLVQRAAVLGHVVGVKALAAVAGLDPGQVERRMTALVSRRVFDAELDPRTAERGRFRFVQSVTREVALATLARAERRDLHLRVADHFEQTGDEEAFPAVAHHLTEALAAAPDGGEELATRAVGALDRAASRASTLGSHEQELAFLERAAALAHDGATTVRLTERAMWAAAQAGLYARAVGHAQQALAHHRRGGDAEAEALVAGRLAHLLSMEGRIADAESLVDDVTGRSGDRISDRAIARLEAQRARLRLYQDDAAGGAAAVERAAAAANRAGDVETIIDSMVTRAWAFGAMGRTLEFWGITAGALDLAVTHGDVEAEGRARNNLATLAWSDPHRAERIVEEGIVRFRERGHLAHVLTMMARAVGLALGLGRWDRAEELLSDPLREGASLWVENQLVAFDTLLWSFRGEWERAEQAHARLREMLGDAEITQDRAFLLAVDQSVAEARGDFRAALESATRSFETSSESSEATFATLGLLAVAAGDLERAATELERLESLPVRSERGRAHGRALAGIIAVRRGAVASGAEEALAAIDALRRLELPTDVANLSAELAVALPPDDPARDDAAGAARELWSELGARALLDVLDRRLAP